MPEPRSVMPTLAGSLTSAGVALLIFKAASRRELSWWTDPILWIGATALTAGAFLFAWLIVVPWLRTRQARRERIEQTHREGRANQRQGLDEIATELGQISSQLKAELRWGKRGALFPNSAWVKNQHLVTGDIRASIDDAYEQAYRLGEETLAASREDLDSEEMERRQQAKATVDAAAYAIGNVRDAIDV
jgi:hypothetical protein